MSFCHVPSSAHRRDNRCSACFFFLANRKHLPGAQHHLGVEIAGSIHGQVSSIFPVWCASSPGVSPYSPTGNLSSCGGVNFLMQLQFLAPRIIFKLTLARVTESF